MTTTLPDLDARPNDQAGEPAKLGIIDCDVHPLKLREHHQRGAGVLSYLPERWRRHALEVGVARGGFAGGDRPRPREFGQRWDTETPSGGPPGSDPAFAAEQLLDRYEISGALLNDLGAFSSAGMKGQPAGFAAAYCRALNEHRRDNWLAQDPRWYASINLPYELPELAVREIEFCMEEMGEYNGRFKQIMLAPDNLRPPGHPSYWPIYEACEHYDIPVTFHVMTANRVTPSGGPNYYFEEHTDYAAFNFPLVASYVFEGTLDRFPSLKIVLVELGWSWALPLAWRLDAAQRVLGAEVPDLRKRPSQYLRDNFYFTTQPMEEPEENRHLDEVFEAFYESGMGEKLMYSSDYPHWDFDEPAALPRNLSPRRRAAVLGGVASELYGIPLLPGQGYPL
ncbi:amidohydrolase family protein [Phytohabitans sp. ZYX-F-186]|uniref:Amidohydrolase family protein n=1 Tax=Phytohabitans maris TaxID=3071409 RepID=A0ABU0ZA31_9ACTN|nr:amidohydrolase family protein [Phytohabitans sp. ZYX-F-186]MDQ7903895.1 amidohydrolase family protein [Phytohabitans sp. ZYX-F-186]